MVQHLRASGVAVRPATTHGVGRDPMTVLREAERIARQDPDGFDTVWLLIDVDDHAHLAECLRAATDKSFNAVVSHPCF
ncbi:RloB family protein [Actinoplanes sp. NPDC048796]|uniref:RloB family protein n=1 Tax=Actinoplanes sp. NPDC048796 TaxID=3155640 RepID=UPI0033F8C96A